MLALGNFFKLIDLGLNNCQIDLSRFSFQRYINTHTQHFSSNNKVVGEVFLFYLLNFSILLQQGFAVIDVH